MRYVALIRGINVGGNGIVRMTDLCACFGRLGFTEVSTYIQSGNVLFGSTLKSTAKLTALVENAMEQEFGCGTTVVVLAADALRTVVESAPPGFGTEAAKYRYDVTFLKDHVDAAELLPTIRLRDGVDQMWAGPGVLYSARLTEQATKSLLPKITAHPAYKSMTIRNWNTTTKLHKLLSA